MAAKIPAKSGLSTAARTWWHKIAQQYDLDAPATLVLLAGLKAYDRMLIAEATIADEGLTVLTERGTVRTHPACAIERDARNAMLAAFRALKMPDSVADLTRPGSGRSQGYGTRARTEDTPEDVAADEVMAKYLNRRK